jgi:hypothetical protein
MSKPARTLFVFGIYLAVLGLTLVTVPNLLLGVFGFPAAQDVWIRVVGMLVFLLAFYYVEAARHEWDGFARASVPARTAVIVFFAAFVLAGFVSPMLLLFGAVDLAGAAGTYLALRQSAAPAVA